MPVSVGGAGGAGRPAGDTLDGMRSPLAAAASAVSAVSAVLFLGGCVSVPHEAPPAPPRPTTAAVTGSATPKSPARPTSSVPAPSLRQPEAFTALVRVADGSERRRRAEGERRPVTAPRRLPDRPGPATRPRTAERPAPARPASPPRPRQHPPAAPRARGAGPRDAGTDDLRTVCGWSGESVVPPSVRALCDTYVR
ncbi:hypothetical protein ACIPPJ_00045 [Streptomyces sp. NPDC086091]|uniref:hypothetical protein n=1 Tax=Streptomyces sp. NPDC086091 TaxID=3365751 RepID=UPI0038229350